jgi:hypothetical protein
MNSIKMFKSFGRFVKDEKIILTLTFNNNSF